MRTFVIAAVLIVLALPAAADFEIYELAPPIRDYDPTWPADGSPWHGIHPGPIHCTFAEQTDHDDTDGNGQIDACESIQLDGVWRHVEWIGPTITLTYLTARDVSLRVEPVVYGPGRPPAPNEYHIVYPEDVYCTTILTDIPLEQVCDVAMILEPPEFFGPWHIEAIDTNIHVGTGSPVEQSTWGKIKEAFRSMF